MPYVKPAIVKRRMTSVPDHSLPKRKMIGVPGLQIRPVEIKHDEKSAPPPKPAEPRKEASDKPPAVSLDPTYRFPTGLEWIQLVAHVALVEAAKRMKPYVNMTRNTAVNEIGLVQNEFENEKFTTLINETWRYFLRTNRFPRVQDLP